MERKMDLFSISKRFLASMGAFIVAGGILGKLYPHLNEKGRDALKNIISSENAAPITFDTIAAFSVSIMALFIIFRGRISGEPSKIRAYAVYYPAEFALSYAAVFLVYY